jgi:hypothetical protein
MAQTARTGVIDAKRGTLTVSIDRSQIGYLTGISLQGGGFAGRACAASNPIQLDLRYCQSDAG